MERSPAQYIRYGTPDPSLPYLLLSAVPVTPCPLLHGTYRWWYAMSPPAHHTGVYGGTYRGYVSTPQGDVVLEPTGVLDWVY